MKNPWHGTTDVKPLLTQLAFETTRALQRIYTLDESTPLDSIELSNGSVLNLKREDLSLVHSYKWRGSFNKISSLRESGFEGPMIAASAGNHAQGVAVSANRMKIATTIFMPRSTPLLKQDSVRRFGGQYVEMKLVGDSFDEAAVAAKLFAEETQGVIIPPYDDIEVIAGQATIGHELTQQMDQPPTHVFLEVGGGGMASGVASVVAQVWPAAKIIVVEAIDQDSMGRSLGKGERTRLETLDKFCDGTAVAIPGELPFQVCKELVHEYLTVSNQQVCEAIQYLWQAKRIIVEPSAGLGVAAAMSYPLSDGDRPLTVLSGSNVDFMMLPKIARLGQINRPEQRYYAFEIAEQSGSLSSLLDNFLSNMNIIDFQYGKVANNKAVPVIGIEVPNSEVRGFEAFLSNEDVPDHYEVTGTAAAEFRVIPFNVDLLSFPFFAVIEFPNRPGALRDFMRGASQLASVCYMNYTDTGQTEGQALMGFEFPGLPEQSTFLEWLQASAKFDVVPMTVVKGLQGKNND